MTWSDFITAVRTFLPVDAGRFNVGTGATNYIDSMITQAVIEIQSTIEFYRANQETAYQATDLSIEGMASVGTLPDGCMPDSAWMVKIGSPCVRQPMWDYDWQNRHDLVCGACRVRGRQYSISIDPKGQLFYAFPQVDATHQISLYWDGLKTSFSGSDSVPFGEAEALVVADFVKARISREVDKDIALAQSYQATYMAGKRRLLADSKDRGRLKKSNDSPSAASKCGNSLSICGFRVPSSNTDEFISFGSSGDPTHIADTLSVSNLVKSLDPDIIVHLGDANYPSGDPVGLLDNLVRFYSGFIPAAFYLALGDVDMATDGGVALETMLVNQAALNEKRYWFDLILKNTHIFVLDMGASDAALPADWAAQTVWLQSKLSASSAYWNVVVLHRPPYSSDAALAGGSAAARLPFSTWGAHLVISGHSETYERLQVAGFPYLVCGLGGAGLGTFGAPVTGSQQRYNAMYGALWVAATTTRLQAQFFNTLGDVVDQLTLTKVASA